MRMILKSLIIIFTMFSLPAYSGEITDEEYGSGYLNVTYHLGTEGKVECTAFNLQGKAVGGGKSYTAGGVARVLIDIPRKYITSKDLKVSCK